MTEGCDIENEALAGPVEREHEPETPGMYQVYILTCSDGSLYTGIARDAAKRLALHNSGKGAKYTRSRRPCVISYMEEVPGRSLAQSRERQIKRLTRDEKLSLIHAYSAAALMDVGAGTEAQAQTQAPVQAQAQAQAHPE